MDCLACVELGGSWRHGDEGGKVLVVECAMVLWDTVSEASDYYGADGIVEVFDGVEDPIYGWPHLGPHGQDLGGELHA